MRALRSGRQRLAVIFTAFAVIGVIATIALAAGSSPPKLAYTTGGTATPTGPTTAAPGPTTFVVTNTTTKDADFTVLRLHDGADPAAVQKDIDRKLTADQIEAMPFDIVGGTGDARSGHPSSVTFTLAAGTYLVANTTSETRTPSIVLTVSGDPNGATAPAPVTTVTMHDYKYVLSRSIPRSGVVRVINKGKRIHMMIAFKAQNAAGAAKLSKALRKGDQKTVNKLIRGVGTNLDPIAPGQTEDLAAVHYGKGSYVFACFWKSSASKGKSHERLGMTKVISVK